MLSSIKAVKAVSIILTLAFAICAFFMIGGFFNDDLNYFDNAERGCGFFVVAVTLGILALFVVLTVSIAKIQKEMEYEKIAVAEEIKELKKQIKELQK